MVGEIGPGSVILLAVAHDDTERDAEFLANKAANLRIFPDAERKLNRSLLDVGGEALVISQFTLYGDCRKGRRPSFTRAAGPEKGEALYRSFAERLRGHGVTVAEGVFRETMLVEIYNDGPVTLIASSDHLPRSG